MSQALLPPVPGECDDCGTPFCVGLCADCQQEADAFAIGQAGFMFAAFAGCNGGWTRDDGELETVISADDAGEPSRIDVQIVANGHTLYSAQLHGGTVADLITAADAFIADNPNSSRRYSRH